MAHNDSNIKEELKFRDSTVMEGTTSIYAIIDGISKKTNNRKIERVLFDSSKCTKKVGDLKFLESKAKELGFEIELCSAERIDELTIGSTHGGVIALCGERTFDELSDKTLEKIKPDGFYVMIEGIEDPYNFGYALRSLYAAGADGIILAPRNWMGAAGVVARASAGASEMFSIFVSEPCRAIELLRSKGYKTVCAGIRDSVSIYDADLKKPVFLIVGGEKRGISRNVLNMTDETVRIDYGRNFRGSLSAASAATVISFEIMHQNMKK